MINLNKDNYKGMDNMVWFESAFLSTFKNLFVTNKNTNLSSL